MNKIIVKGHEARQKVLAGVFKIEDVVRMTYGPFGHNIICGKGNLRPNITKDGATVVGEVDSDDPYEKIGIEMTKDVVSKVDATSGDGTTTTTIYYRALMEGAEKLASLGFNCRNVRNGMMKATDTAVAFLEKNKIKTQDVRAIADIASNGSKEITDLLVEAVDSVGEDGAIHLDESTRKDGKSYLVKSVGYTWPEGYPSSLFISNQADKSSVVREPWVLVSDQALQEKEEWDTLELIRTQAELSKKNFVIIAPGFNSTFYSEAAKHGVLFIKAPDMLSSSEKRMDHLTDIATLLGTRVVPEWSTLSTYIKSPKDLGTCETITAKKDMTTIILPEELSEEHAKKIEDHIAELRKTVDKGDELTKTMQDYLNNRIADLSGGVCTIYVGALTPTEKEEKYALFLDSLNSVNSAIKFGVLPGGGTALLKTSYYLLNNPPKKLTPEEKAGWDLVAKTLAVPAKVLIETIKPEDYQYLVQQVSHIEDFQIGYDLINDKVCNLVDIGIIDAVKIEEDVIRYSCSSACSFILSDGVIVNGAANMTLDCVDRYVAEGGVL